MKNLLVLVINAYQLVSPALHQLLGIKSMCRYATSCSEYAKQVINEHGALKGTQLAGRRLLSCQPFTKSYGNI